ncbi:MAG: hypothetical protein U0984_06820 [Prosthecobacter sp.]|nr:hypothetical protein [Prosthecobacter sp.]
MENAIREVAELHPHLSATVIRVLVWTASAELSPTLGTKALVEKAEVIAGQFKTAFPH